eukprot:tig00000237_g20464.t1
MDAHFTAKVAVLGDQETGKTSLVERRCVVAVGEDPLATGLGFQNLHTGLRFKSEIVPGDMHRYGITYWDIPGSSLDMAARYAAGAAGLVFVFDVTNATTFDHLQDWIAAVEGIGTTPQKMILANKLDLLGAPEGLVREVGRDEAERFARERGCWYFEASAVTGLGLDDAFESLVSNIVRSIPTPAEPSALLRTGVRIGARLTQDPSYWRSLYPDVIAPPKVEPKFEVPLGIPFS